MMLSMALIGAMFCSVTVVKAAETPANTFEVNQNTVKILGRSFTQNEYTCFSYGSSGIAVNFTGTDFYIDVAQLDGANPSTDIMVLVDTLMPMEATKYTVTANTGWLKIASGLSDGEHSIRIMKMSRGIGAGGWFGTDWFGIRAIGVNGGSVLTPDPKSDLIIEAYGDSITNGDAVWLNPDGTNNSYTWGAYSGVVARILGADVYSTGNTGNGLNSWCLGAGNLFPPRESWDKQDIRANQEQAVDHSETDVVIINLGTNDLVAITNNSEECAQYTEEAFKQSYISWMQDIRRDAPNAIVIAALGAMGGDILFDDIEAAVNEVNAQAGETYAYFLQLAKCSSISGGMGYDNAHPSNVAHEIYGAQMAQIITEALGLNDVDLEGKTNLALGKGVISDSVMEGTVATSATDGDYNTYWQSNATGVDAENAANVGVELGTAYEFDALKINWHTAANTAYVVEYSTDGKTYTAVTNQSVSRNGTVDTVTFNGVYASYVRIVISGMDGKNTNPAVYEFEVYNSHEVMEDNTPEVDKTINLAVNAAPIDSGEEYYSADNTAEKAFDGNTATSWQYAKTMAELGNIWLGAKLDTASLMEKAVITWETSTRPAEGGYVLQYSSDGVNWTTVTSAEYSYGSDNNGIVTDTVTFTGVNAQYLRILCTSSSNEKFSPKVCEFEIYA